MGDDRKSSTGSRTIIRGFADRALDGIIEVRDDMQDLRREMNAREERMERAIQDLESRRKEKDVEHDNRLQSQNSLISQLQIKQMQEMSALRNEIQMKAAEMERRMDSRLDEQQKEINALDKRLAVTIAKGGAVGTAGGGLVTGIIMILQHLF